MMKTLLAVTCLIATSVVNAATPSVLERALACKLHDAEIPSLLGQLAQTHPVFNKPSAQYGAPTANVYELESAVKAWGYSSKYVVVMPARILLAVSGVATVEAVGKLKLEESSYAPASRTVRPNVSVVAFQLSHKALENKLLIGCEYAVSSAANWPESSQ